MRLYDAFMTCEREKLANEIAQILPTEYNPTEEQLSKASHKLVAASFARMSDTVPSGDNKYILYVANTFATEDFDAQYDAFGVKTEALKEWQNNHPANPFVIEEEENADTEDLHELITSLTLPDRYCLEFLEWQDILSYPLSDKCVERYGLELCLAHILFEMTFFGVEPEGMEKQSEELEQSIKECEKARAEGNEDYFVPAEEVFAELFAEYSIEPPTEEERQKWRRDAAISAYRFDRELWALL